MKAGLLAIFFAANVAQADVIECPATNLGARLSGAGMYEGDKKQYELMGEPEAVRGGHDVRFGFDGGKVKWIACRYEPTSVRWYQAPTAAKRCKLKKRTLNSRQVKATIQCE